MKKIYILGAGGLAKEVYALISDIGGYEVEGFIDLEEKEPVRIGDRVMNIYAESHLGTISPKPLLAIGVGDPKIIQKLAAKFGDAFEFPNLIHPSVIGHFKDISLQKGNIITFGCILTTSIQVGSFNIFNFACTVGHDTVIGNYNVINPAVNISGGVTIGNTNLLGVNATILQYKKIGSNSIVGASALVTKDVEDNVLVAGVPAVKLKNL